MTRQYKKTANIDHKLVAKICDGCDKSLTLKGYENGTVEDDEWLGFETFGFGSVHSSLFDSDMHYELDLCRNCAVKLFKKLLKKKRRQVLKDANKRTNCGCIEPILLGHQDVPSIPEGYARCQKCKTYFKCEG